jgi:hypothetical protein
LWIEIFTVLEEVYEVGFGVGVAVAEGLSEFLEQLWIL